MVHMSDLRSNEHYLSSSENKGLKKIQASTGFEPMSLAIPTQCSTKGANGPTNLEHCCLKLEVELDE